MKKPNQIDSGIEEIKDTANEIDHNLNKININKEDNNVSLSYWAYKILTTPDPKSKANLTEEIVKKWFNEEIHQVGDLVPPDAPERTSSLKVVDPSKIRRGKGGTLASRIALLHSLANIEQVNILIKILINII